MSPPSDLPSTSDFLDNLDFFAIALVVSATIFPGLTLCIPGLLFVTVLIAIPIVAVALVVGPRGGGRRGAVRRWSAGFADSSSGARRRSHSRPPSRLEENSRVRVAA